MLPQEVGEGGGQTTRTSPARGLGASAVCTLSLRSFQLRPRPLAGPCSDPSALGSSSGSLSQRLVFLTTKERDLMFSLDNQMLGSCSLPGFVF